MMKMFPLINSYLSSSPRKLCLKQLSDFTVIKIDSCFTENILTTFSSRQFSFAFMEKSTTAGWKSSFSPINSLHHSNGLQHDVLLVYAETPPDYDSIIRQSIISIPCWNIMLSHILPGKSKPGK